ncbi:FAD/NAD(P)-dependent oxidoreductase [Salinivibrio proteolyticus]|uniref:NAD(P)/FAD-dependent oxidoreductase n=1 Tax=Salinivibrio proteolyticus TaxID=334715 RepID=A0ABY7LJS9_9GAMM|nr:NAD(P)/FAD-dependent oxidoreductase [Salinivibrio proteolyticus]WBA16462.1 NAD(P)/FAD-dependent oxidoreductase [Salinivibrio proteolyticus]
MSKPVVIVGAGPAGLSAAVTLAKHKVASIIVDEAPKPGGVVYRGPWRDTDALPHLDDKWKATSQSLREQYRQHQDLIDLRSLTRVLGPMADQHLLTAHEDTLSTIDYEQLILATGCQERSIPFPGWDMPGVMLLGGIQLQIKSGLVRPGHRCVITGTGPLLVLVACQLHKAGCDIAGIYEAAPFKDLARETLALLNRPQLALDGLSMMMYLKRHHIPMHYGWGVVKASGDPQVEHVTVAPYSKDWHPDVSRAETINADLLGVGYGFAARSQLAQLMGLDMQYDHMSGAIPVVDEWQRASLDNVYCAGDTVKFAGAEAAMLEGKIAAYSALKARNISMPNLDNEFKALRHQLEKSYRFRKGFDTAGYRRPGLLSLPEKDTVICRCEQVKKADIDNAINQGVKDVITLKMRTRVTMGDCQGKTCAHYCYDRLNESTTSPQPLIRPRFPLDPIPFAALEDDA